MKYLRIIILFVLSIITMQSFADVYAQDPYYVINGYEGYVQPKPSNVAICKNFIEKANDTIRNGSDYAGIELDYYYEYVSVQPNSESSILCNYKNNGSLSHYLNGEYPNQPHSTNLSIEGVCPQEMPEYAETNGYLYNDITNKCEKFCKDDEDLDTSIAPHQCKKRGGGGSCKIEKYGNTYRGFDFESTCQNFASGLLDLPQYYSIFSTELIGSQGNLCNVGLNTGVISYELGTIICDEGEETACPDGTPKDENGECPLVCPLGYIEQGDTCVLDDSDDGGEGDGTGDGSGDGTGDGSGDGTGDGSGDGSGDGTGDGEGDGSGDGSGDGTGDGEGDGSGDGEGDGSGDGTGDANPNDETPFELPEFCDWATKVCDFIDWVQEEPLEENYSDIDPPNITDVDGVDDFDINEKYVDASGECPAPESLSVMGGTIQLSYEPLCIILEKLAPILVACAYMAGAFLIIRTI